METTSYSLNNKKCLINTRDTIRIIENKSDNIKININNTHLFDNYCIELYGYRTCILFHIDLNNIEVRLLDRINYDQIKYINKKSLYNEIPNLLKNNYTVVLVEKLLDTNTTEITTIHLPPNKVI
jgi:hypothetical protein